MEEEDSGKKDSKSATNKADKQFSYFSVGETVKVLLKSDESDLSIVLHDLSSVKRNKKFLLRQLAILNENHTDAGSSNGVKRKLSEFDSADDTILIKKKLVLNDTDKSNKLKKKRKLSENGDDADMIEIVSDVKKATTKKNVSDVEVNANGKASAAEENGHSENGIGSAFTWEVTDFDQFDAILNKKSVVATSVVTNGAENGQKKETQPKKLKKNEKSATVEEDLAIHQVKIYI